VDNLLVLELYGINKHYLLEILAFNFQIYAQASFKKHLNQIILAKADYQTSK
jgi:hypothetical protein